MKPLFELAEIEIGSFDVVVSGIVISGLGRVYVEESQFILREICK